MAMQATVSQFISPGARGLIANAETRNIVSRTLGQGKGPLAFGSPVYRGAKDNLCSQIAADGAFLGLSRRSGVLDPSNTPIDNYNAGDSVAIMTEGVMWVEVAAAVAQGAHLNYDTVALKFTTAAVAGNVIAVPGVEADTATTAAGIAKARVFRTIP